MTNQTLRELARGYAQGKLDKATYQKSRAALIQGIVSEEIKLEEIDYPPLVQPPEPESLDETQRKDQYKTRPAKQSDPETVTEIKNWSDTPPADSENAGAGNSSPANNANAGAGNSSPANNANARAGNSSKIFLAGLALAIIVIVIVAVSMLSGDGKTEKKVASTEGGEDNTVMAANAEANSKGQALIKDFLTKNSWSGSSLDDFLAKWTALSESEIVETGSSLAMDQLANAIYKQLLAEQALSGLIDDDSSLKKQRKLVEFATALRIEDDRIYLPEEVETSAAAAGDLLEER